MSEIASIPLRTELSGFWSLQAIRPDGQERALGAFQNLITDYGLDEVGKVGNWLSRCSVGTDNTAPSVSDTALGGFVASTGNTIVGDTSIVTSSPRHLVRTQTFEFSAGAAAGNLAEIGIGAANDGTGLFSRALILDGSGNPTTITVQSDEILRATYECRLYIPESDVTGSADISGTTYNWTARAANADTIHPSLGWEMPNRAGLNYGCEANDGTMGTIDGAPVGASSSGSENNNAYVDGSYERTATIYWDASSANFGSGIKSLYVSGKMTAWQVEFDTAIPKTDTEELTLNVTISWARRP